MLKYIQLIYSENSYHRMLQMCIKLLMCNIHKSTASSNVFYRITPDKFQELHF